MEIKQCYLTLNDCYKRNTKITPKGVVIHSTGANNPNLCRYVQPDDGILGKNSNNNDWNRGGLDVCVNAFIGKDKNGTVRCYQTLPWDVRPWGCGSGSKGSYNDSYIQFEICEDALNNKDYFDKVFGMATDLCAYLVKKYNISLDNVVSHQEAYKKGYASNHADCDHWLKKFGYTMDDIRKAIKAKISTIQYRVHQQTYGWSDWVSEEQVAGVTGKSKRLEAVQLNPNGKEIYCQAHIQGLGWVNYGRITKDTIIGTVGEARRLEAIELKGASVSCHI